VQLCLALLLLTAAGLKTHQLATEPVMETGILESRWFLIALVESELFVAFWLIAGLLPVWTWRASIMLFAAFACVSLGKALAGEASCGCFGRVSVSPWFTFTLDVGVVAALLRWRPVAGSTRVRSTSFSAVRTRLATVFGLWLSVGLASGSVMGGYRPINIGDGVQLLRDGRTVVLEPDLWIGKRFPLLDWIEIDAAMDEGQWTVVLHRPWCSDCEKLLRRFGERNMRTSFPGEGSVAFVDVEAEHGGAIAIPKGPSFFHGALPVSYRWFVQTPVKLELLNGIVQQRPEGNKGKG